MQKNTIIIFIVSLVLLVGGAMIFTNFSGSANNDTVVLAEKVKGNPESAVVLEDFSDFQCPACASFEPVINNILDEYGDQLRFEYHHFPLITIHQNAELAARASEAAGIQGKFWEMHDVLFERQASWSSSINPRQQFIGYAEELGLDGDLFARHLNNGQVKEAVQAGMRDGRDRGITGTPSFYLNGEKMDFSTFAEFKQQIEVAIGVAPEESLEANAGAEFSF